MTFRTKNDEPALCSGSGVKPVGALWDCVPRVCSSGGGAGGCVAVSAAVCRYRGYARAVLVWVWGGVSRENTHHS